MVPSLTSRARRREQDGGARIDMRNRPERSSGHLGVGTSAEPGLCGRTAQCDKHLTAPYSDSGEKRAKLGGPWPRLLLGHYTRDDTRDVTEMASRAGTTTSGQIHFTFMAPFSDLDVGAEQSHRGA